MKKLLALVLALVMTLSLCTITNAADFTDAADVDYTEAVEVMKAVGVLAGYEDGSFQPDKAVTRAEAAKIIAYLDLGQKTADALTKDVAPFADVAAGNWAAGYIAYCAQTGIIAGVGDNKFAPNAQVTALQFAKMLLCVLGYDATIEGLTGIDWSINVSKKAAQIDLLKGVDTSATAPATRQEIAQYAFNALKANTVGYTSKGTKVTVNGIDVVTAASDASVVTSTAAYADDITNEMGAGAAANVLQLGESLYKGDLKLNNTATTDGLSHPANVWTWKGETVGTYAAAADHTIVVAKQGKTVAEMIDTVSKDFVAAKTGNVGADNTNHVYLNGDNNASATAYTTAMAAKVGDVIELYMADNDVNLITDVVITRYSSAKLTADVKTKGTAGKDLEVRLTGVYAGYLDEDNVNGWEDLKKDDVVYFYVDKGGVYNLFKAEMITGKLTSVKNKTPLQYVVEGTDYVINGNTAVAALSSPVYNTTYNYFLDNNGFVVYAVAVEDELSEYVAVQALAHKTTGGIGGGTKVEARLVKMDGTTEIVTLASVKVGGTTYADGTGSTTAMITGSSLNGSFDTAVKNTTLFTYTVNSDGEYELVDALGSGVAQNAQNTVAVTNGKAKMTYPTSNSITVDDETVFVVAKGTTGSNVYKYNVYTGKANVPDIVDADIVYAVKNGVAKYVYVYNYSGSLTNTGDSVFFLKAWGVYTSEKLEDNTYLRYNVYDAVVNGELSTVKVKADAYGHSINTGDAVDVALFAPTYDNDGIITNLAADGADDAVAYGYQLTGTSFKTPAQSYICAADVPVFYIDDDGDINELVAGDLDKDANDAVYVVRTSASNETAKFIVIKDVAEGLAATAKVMTATDTIASLKAGTAFNGNVAGSAWFDELPTWGLSDANGNKVALFKLADNNGTASGSITVEQLGGWTYTESFTNKNVIGFSTAAGECLDYPTNACEITNGDYTYTLTIDGVGSYVGTFTVASGVATLH